MNRLLRNSALKPADRWETGDHVLTAHKWAKLIETGNRWSVYPSEPKKIFQFDNWNPVWQDMHG